MTDFIKLQKMKQKMNRPVDYWPIPQRLERSEIKWLIDEVERLADVHIKNPKATGIRFTAKHWNELYADGQPVIYYSVIRENGTPDKVVGKVLETKTRSEAWTLTNGHPVVLIEGIAGCVALNHLAIKVDYNK